MFFLALIGSTYLNRILLNFSVDWLFSWFLCEQVKMLGCPKALVKKSFKVVPIIGWTAFFSENAFLERVYTMFSFIKQHII